MEPILVAISLTSLLTNIYIIHRFTGHLKAETELFTFDPITLSEYGKIDVVGSDEVAAEVECKCANCPTAITQTLPVADDTEKYQAWRNIKEQPIIAPPPVPLVKQDNGPQARPYGFV